MAGTEQKHPTLNLSPEEQQLFGQVFSAADKDSLGVVTGDVALGFFPERTKLPVDILGEIWQIADTEDKGFLTPSGFYIVLRLIGYAQAGRPVSAELALQAGGPLPRFDGINPPQTIPTPAAQLQPQASGTPIPVPRLTPDKAAQYATLFEQSGAQNGMLSGVTAKQIFDKAQLPNEILARIWNLVDTEQRGQLSVTEFIIAMHLLASYRGGSMRALPQLLPAGLYEAAARRGAPPSRQTTGVRPPPDGPPVSALPRQFTGPAVPSRTSSPLTRQPYIGSSIAAQTTGAIRQQNTGDWAIPMQQQAQYNAQFARLDTSNKGHVSGDEAVPFFSRSGLSEDDLATIWDLADINSTGQLSRDEFAVALHLIGQKRTTSAPIPATLPANLVPPGMRKQLGAAHLPTTHMSPQNTGAPAPKSATDDLFGLDALSSVPVLVPHSTGESSGLPSSSPRTAIAPPPTQAPATSSTFKPFVPSSSFGQGIMPQATGNSVSAERPRSGPRAMNDDLLGNNDPEISNKLTQETSEQADLSNQVRAITIQMQDVGTKRAAAEQSLSQMSAQKREFESRLLQLRPAYEQQARALKTMEENLTTTRNETMRLHQDVSAAEQQQQTLRDQYQQMTAALEVDQKENAGLKDRMRETNSEITQLRPMIEKVRADARQQKGLVAINKKQLATVELELERLKSELEAATKEHQDAITELKQNQASIDATTREHEEATRQLGDAHKAREEAARRLGNVIREREQTVRRLEDTNRELTETRQNIVQSPLPTVASPTPSTSMNPFLKRSGTMTSERGILSPSNVTSSPHNDFDDFFGPPSVPGPSLFPPPPELNPPSANVDNIPGDSINPASVPLPPASVSIPPASAIPPSPPPSRQITSSELPLRAEIPRAPSPTSSIGVAPPLSRDVSLTGFGTPQRQNVTNSNLGSSRLNQSTLATSPSGSANTSHGPSPSRSEPIGISSTQEVGQSPGESSASPDIPGAFPAEPTPFQTPQHTVDRASSDRSTTQSSSRDPFAAEQQNSTPAGNDFDAAFESFQDNGKGLNRAGTNAFDNSDSRTGGALTSVPVHGEFPPIQEFGGDSSDSDSEQGFEDDFTNTSRQAPAATESSKSCQPPTPSAQQPPPAYNQAVVPNRNPDGHRDSNQFPAEYRGLLPSREDPTSHSAITSPGPIVPSPQGQSGTFFGGASARDRATFGGFLPAEQMPMALGASTSAPFAYSNGPLITQPAYGQIHAQPPDPSRSTFDDFENEFGDLSEAQVVDERGDDDFFSQHRDNADEFNPTFDFPTPSKATAALGFRGQEFGNNTFHDVESNTTGSAFVPPAPQPASTNVDWDAMFAGMGTNISQAGPVDTNHQELVNDAFGGPPVLETSTKPPIRRVLSVEEDDPILKRLTNMGYPRDQSLQALEKFDYNLDKAADSLASRS